MQPVQLCPNTQMVNHYIILSICTDWSEYIEWFYFEIYLVNTSTSEIYCYQSGACDNIQIITHNDKTTVPFYAKLTHQGTITIIYNVVLKMLILHWSTNELPIINKSILDTLYNLITCQMVHAFLTINIYTIWLLFNELWTMPIFSDFITYSRSNTTSNIWAR